MIKTLITVFLTGKASHWQNKRFIASLFFVMVSFLMLLGGLQYHIYQGSHFYVIYINGHEVGLLAEKAMLEEIQHTLQQEASLFYGRPVMASESVKYEEVYRPEGEAEREKVISHLRNTQIYKVDAFMITIGEYDVVPVADTDAVDDVIAMVASAYIPSTGNVSLQDVYVVEQIGSRPFMCHPEDLRDAESVASILLRGTDRRETYLVSRGDSLSVIAHENNISIDELREANPQLEGDFLQIGDELNLILAEPLVNVITKERIEVSEKIPFETVYVSDSSLWSGQTKVLEKGVNGSRDVVYEITRENGQEISREIITSVVTSEPSPQKVARGTASTPSPQGTGSFIWPVQGGGRLTSGYGWRSGGFHSGIDICAPRGTNVLAADSGVVVFVGWDGGYGNSVVLHHGTYYTRYAHHSKNLVSHGQSVKQGEVIALIGSTGRSTANHLHFEIRTGGIYGSSHDPLKFFKP